jgi:hypothetical protein
MVVLGAHPLVEQLLSVDGESATRLPQFAQALVGGKRPVRGGVGGAVSYSPSSSQIAASLERYERRLPPPGRPSGSPAAGSRKRFGRPAGAGSTGSASGRRSRRPPRRVPGPGPRPSESRARARTHRRLAPAAPSPRRRYGSPTDAGGPGVRSGILVVGARQRAGSRRPRLRASRRAGERRRPRPRFPLSSRSTAMASTASASNGSP